MHITDKNSVLFCPEGIKYRSHVIVFSFSVVAAADRSQLRKKLPESVQDVNMSPINPKDLRFEASDVGSDGLSSPQVWST